MTDALTAVAEYMEDRCRRELWKAMGCDPKDLGPWEDALAEAARLWKVVKTVSEAVSEDTGLLRG